MYQIYQNTLIMKIFLSPIQHVYYFPNYNLITYLIITYQSKNKKKLIAQAMIQNLTNMIKQAYFSQLKQHHPNTKHFIKHKPSYLKNHRQKIPNELSQICTLIKSQQRCQNWILLIQNHKQNYIIKQTLYNAIIQGNVNVHNLFLMMIQCRVLSDQIWIPIQKLCKLKGDKQNQLCCLIHFTVMNLGKKYKHIHNPQRWTKQKAQEQMGTNFQRTYNRIEMLLDQKIAILPMLIILNNKNSPVLWNRLKWLYDLPNCVMFSLRTNMNKLLGERVSQAIGMMNSDYFAQKMCIKSIQLLQGIIVQGFVSAKNLFTFAYQLYNISLLLTLLGNYQPGYSNQSCSFRILLIDFLVQLFDCMESYEYQFDFGKDNKDMNNLCKISYSIEKIIIKNRLYMQQLKNIRFNQQIQNLITKYQKQVQHKNIINIQQIQQTIKNVSRVQTATKSLQEWFMNSLKSTINISNNKNNYTNIITLAKIIPRCSSEEWVQKNMESTLFQYTDQSQSMDNAMDNQQLMIPQTIQEKISRFRSHRQQTILTHILGQLYSLKIDYLQILHTILVHCYQENDEQPWSEINSSFYKLQLYLIRNYLLEFLVYNFNAIQTKNNPVTMICYYKVLGFLLRGNPIAYGKLDRILLDIEQQQGNPIHEKQTNNKNKTHKNSHNLNMNTKSKKLSKKTTSLNQLLANLSSSFLQNVALSKSTIIMILSDQFEWKENYLQSYPNAAYQSVFVTRIIEEQKVQWLVYVIQSICCVCANNQVNEKDQIMAQKKEQIFNKNNQKFEWITLLLVLYYYFQETMEIVHKNKKNNKTNLSKQKIHTPNRQFVDRILEKEQFMQKLYPIKIKIMVEHKLTKYQSQNNFQLKQNQNIQNQHSFQPIFKKQRILNVLIEFLDKWEEFYNKNSKKSIMQFGLSYPMLRVFKKKLKSRVAGFVKTKQFEENGEQFYYNYSRKIKSKQQYV